VERAPTVITLTGRVRFFTTAGMKLHRVRQEFPRSRIASERIEPITVLRFDGIGATASGDLFFSIFQLDLLEQRSRRLRDEECQKIRPHLKNDQGVQ
jgi:hypothetical protein